MKPLRLHILLLTIILLVGLGIRVYALDKNPAGFFCDEAAIGYNAYTILTTGKDEYGVSYPAFFKSFGEYKSPVAIYAAVPFIQLFGLNELSTRMQSVFFGLITILMIYLLTKQLFTKNIALLSAAIAATMPWLIHYNRTGFEMNSYLAFLTATLWLLLKAIKQKAYIVPAFFIASLSLYTYYSAKLIVPLFIICFFLIYGKKLLVHKKELTLSAVLFLFLSIPFLLSFINGQGTARFHEVSVFTANLAPTDTVLRILNNYVLQLTPTLFLHGEPTFITRHFAGGLHPLLFTTIPFFYIGIAFVIKIWRKPASKLLLLWLILYPLGAAVVADPPFTGRTIIGAPLSAILIALGIAATSNVANKYVSRNIIFGMIITVISINFLVFISFYFQRYPLYSADFWGWQYGPKEIITYFEEQKQSYDELYMIGEFNAPYIFFKFYAPNGCETCSVASPHEVYNPTKKQLFAISPTYQETHPEIAFLVKKTVYYPNGKVAFLIGEVQ